MIKELVIQARTRRRFIEDKPIDKNLLTDFVDTIRQTASARNIQPLKFGIVCEKEKCDKLFDTLGWAGYLENGAPKSGERPAAYIILFNDNNIAQNSLWDQGIMAQTLVLAAAEHGIGACIIASVNRAKAAALFAVPEHLEIALVVALGYPNEEVRIVELQNNEYKYWRDENNVHYVPKRSLEEVTVHL